MKKVFALFVALFVCCGFIFAQTPEQFTNEVFSFYGVVFGVVMVVVTEIVKLIPWLSKVPSRLLAVIVSAIITIIYYVATGLPVYSSFVWIGIIITLYNLFTGIGKMKKAK